MATPEQREEAISKLKNSLNNLAIIKAADLARIADLSHDINFSDAVPYFEQMLEIARQLNDRDISRLGYNHISQITKALEKITRLMDQVTGFTLNQNTPGTVCNNIINEIKNSYDEIMEPLTLPLAFTATQSTDYAKIEREAKGYHATMRHEAESFSETVQQYLVEAGKALSAVKEQAAEAGVSTNAQIFLQESERHAALSQKWLKGTIVVSAVTLLAAIVFLYISFNYKPETTASAIQYVVSKIILLSIMSFAIFWCSRNYKAQKHNETLNKHRANALMTFRAFVEGAEDDRVKDAVLLQAAQAAFSHRQTGYDSAEKDPQSLNPIVEILGKTFLKSAEGGTGPK